MNKTHKIAELFFTFGTIALAIAFTWNVFQEEYDLAKEHTPMSFSESVKKGGFIFDEEYVPFNPQREAGPSVASNLQALPSLIPDTSAAPPSLPWQVLFSLHLGGQSQRMLLATLRALPAQPPLPSVDVSSYFGWRTDPFHNRITHHGGVDLRAPQGTPVFTPANSVVDSVGFSKSYGLFVLLRHPPTGYTTRFAHLSDFVPTLHHGQELSSGVPVAFVGSTGRSTAPHLHYEIRDADGRPVDPARPFNEHVAIVRFLETQTLLPSRQEQ